jgi:hypothetical protein
MQQHPLPDCRCDPAHPARLCSLGLCQTKENHAPLLRQKHYTSLPDLHFLTSARRKNKYVFHAFHSILLLPLLALHTNDMLKQNKIKYFYTEFVHKFMNSWPIPIPNFTFNFSLFSISKGQ